MAEFEVVIEKDELKFCSAHFIAYDGFREKLHGHNYYLSIKMTGDKVDLRRDGYFVDFGRIKQVAKEVCKSLHERLLLPEFSPVLTIASDVSKANINVSCQDGTHFSFPEDDVILLPIAYSSAEELACYCATQLVQRLTLSYLQERGVRDLEVKIEEGRGQGAVYRCDIAAALSETCRKFTPSAPKPCLTNEMS